MGRWVTVNVFGHFFFVRAGRLEEAGESRDTLAQADGNGNTETVSLMQIDRREQRHTERESRADRQDLRTPYR